VVAHQWWWEFDYPSVGVKTSDVLRVPSATNVRLELASADVLHSFWILGMKDAVELVPGKTRPLDLVVKSPGEIYGNCDSRCGCATVCMRFRVLASSPGSFDQ
jgi:cytochrome c oxidase subunit 2